MNKLMISLLALCGLMLSVSVQAEGTVARAVVTTAVTDREPANDLDKVAASDEKVFFFTELRGMAGQTVKHRWSHGEEVMAEVEFNVGGPRWRVWSSKTLRADWAGTWKVEVVDSEGNVLSEKQFEYGAGEQAMPAEAPAEAASPAEASEPMMKEEDGGTTEMPASGTPASE